MTRYLQVTYDKNIKRDYLVTYNHETICLSAGDNQIPPALTNHLLIDYDDEDGVTNEASGGAPKVFSPEKAKFPFSKGMVTFIGVSELLGVLGLILPSATRIAPILTPIAAIGLAIIMVLGAGFHAKRKEYQGIVTTIIILALAIFVAIGRW